MLDELQMQEGVLPVRYLGVPLISSRLYAVDYRVLLDRISKRIDSWTSRNLSFAGRPIAKFYSLWSSSLLVGHVYSS